MQRKQRTRSTPREKEKKKKKLPAANRVSFFFSPKIQRNRELDIHPEIFAVALKTSKLDFIQFLFFSK